MRTAIANTDWHSLVVGSGHLQTSSYFISEQPSEVDSVFYPNLWTKKLTQDHRVSKQRSQELNQAFKSQLPCNSNDHSSLATYSGVLYSLIIQCPHQEYAMNTTCPMMQQLIKDHSQGLNSLLPDSQATTLMQLNTLGCGIGNQGHLSPLFASTLAYLLLSPLQNPGEA